MIIKLLNHLKRRNRYQKQVLMIIADLILLPISLWIAFSLKVGSIWPSEFIIDSWWLFIISPLISIPFYIHNGLYRWVLKYMGYQVIIATIKAITISTLVIISITSTDAIY